MWAVVRKGASVKKTLLWCLGACVLGGWAAAAHGQVADAMLPQVGGDGGDFFQARCPVGQHLVGLNLRAGHNIDAVQPICAIAATPVALRAGTEMPRFGGDGGEPVQLMCPQATPVVTGVSLIAEGARGLGLNSVHLFCGIAAKQQTASEYPSVKFDGPRQKSTESSIAVTDFVDVRFAKLACPAGLVGVGVYGRAGKIMDALGLICGEPVITESGAKGKVGERTETAAPVKPAGSPVGGVADRPASALPGSPAGSALGGAGDRATTRSAPKPRVVDPR
jgi:hypothetical protein